MRLYSKSALIRLRELNSFAILVERQIFLRELDQRITIFEFTLLTSNARLASSALRNPQDAAERFVVEQN